MKFYDKEMAKREVYIKNIVFMIAMFSLGVIVGFFAARADVKNNENEKPQETVIIQGENSISNQ